MNPALSAFQRMERIMASADGRPLTASQKADYETAATEWFGHAKATVGDGLEHLQAFDAAGDPAVSFKAAGSWMGLSQGRVIRETSPGHAQPSDGVTFLTPDQKLADLRPATGSDMPVGALLKGMCSAMARLRRETKAMSIGADGRSWLPDALSAPSSSRPEPGRGHCVPVLYALPMETSTLPMARVAGDPTGVWHEENAAVAASDASLEAVTLRTRTLTAITKFSIELFEDAVGLNRVVENSLGQALALELDRAALRGIGAAGEPLGIANQPGINSTGSVGSPSSYVSFADTPTLTLRQANAQEPMRSSQPRLFNSLEKLVTGITSDLTRLAPPPAWTAMRRFYTNQVPVDLGAGSNESEAYIGDFGQMAIGMRTSLTLEASRDASDSSSSAFSNLQVWVRAYLRADVALLQPSHFVYLSGILA